MPGRLTKGHFAAFLPDREPETAAGAAGRKEVNTGDDGFRCLRQETGLVNGVPVLGASERGAEGTVRAKAD